MARLWVGTSGWVYKHWTGGLFYPPRLPPAAQLPFYAERFPTVEINYSYYQLPPRARFEAWRRQVPPGFRFAVKASRYLTHLKKLKDPEEPLSRLLEAAGGLAETLGPILFQFPRWWALNPTRLDAFLVALRAHPPRQYAFEFRHPSWLAPEVYDLLRRDNAALCLPVGWGVPLDPRLTADWTYVRFHAGAHGVSFTDEELAPWAARLRGYLEQGVESYVYFNNDPPAAELGGLPAAPANAARLLALLGDLAPPWPRAREAAG